MAEPTLVQIFGVGATQDAATLTIQKSNLPRLTPSANNTPESLLAGILLQAQTQETKANFDSNLDQSIYIEGGYPNFIFRGSDNAPYEVRTLTANLARLDNGATINPDNY